MGGQPTYIKGSVPPGGTYDISVNMVAPQQPGVYQGFWQMVNAKGTAFGTTVYVGIQVVAPTAVPAPTQTPSPTHQLHRQPDQHHGRPVRHLQLERPERQGGLLLPARGGHDPIRRGGPGQQRPVPDPDHDVQPDRDLPQRRLRDAVDHDLRDTGAGRRAGHQSVHRDAAADPAGAVRQRAMGCRGQRHADHALPRGHRDLGQRTRAEHDAGLPTRHRQRHLHVGGDGSRRAEPGPAVRQRRGAAHGSPADRRAAHGSAADRSPADGRAAHSSAATPCRRPPSHRRQCRRPRSPYRRSWARTGRC